MGMQIVGIRGDDVLASCLLADLAQGLWMRLAVTVW
jgi:hypothetical protein